MLSGPRLFVTGLPAPAFYYGGRRPAHLYTLYNPKQNLEDLNGNL